MPPPPRPRFLVGLALGFLLAAGLVALLGPSMPVLAQAARPPALEPFQAVGLPNLTSGGNSQQFDLVPPVPAGKVLVVESMYGHAQVPVGEAAQLGLTAGGLIVPVVLTFQGSWGDFDLYASASPASRLYVPAGSMRGGITTSGDGLLGGALTVVGYLVPAPVTP